MMMKGGGEVYVTENNVFYKRYRYYIDIYFKPYLFLEKSLTRTPVSNLKRKHFSELNF